MSRLIAGIFAMIFTIGISAKLLGLNRWLAEKAVFAHQNQMSYSKFTKTLVNKDPRNPNSK